MWASLPLCLILISVLYKCVVLWSSCNSMQVFIFKCHMWFCEAVYNFTTSFVKVTHWYIVVRIVIVIELNFLSEFVSLLLSERYKSINWKQSGWPALKKVLAGTRAWSGNTEARTSFSADHRPTSWGIWLMSLLNSVARFSPTPEVTDIDIILS